MNRILFLSSEVKVAERFIKGADKLSERFERNFLEHMSISKEELLTNFTREEYKATIDTVIADVPNLANYISTSFRP